MVEFIFVFAYIHLTDLHIPSKSTFLPRITYYAITKLNNQGLDPCITQCITKMVKQYISYASMYNSVYYVNSMDDSNMVNT